MNIIDEANGVQLIRTSDGLQYVYGTRIIGYGRSLRLWGDYATAEREFIRLAG